MKPNFALILSADSVCLLHRTFSGWARVGDVAFDTPDLDASLAQLKGRASHLPGDRSCKLVLPEDQIKYLTVKAGGDPDDTVRAALDGATPYAVDELEYDWTAEGGEIRIAAVALETLAEAESFAVQHGFEPVSFAAIPSGTEFVGEPFFGVTKWAGTALPKGAAIERDDTPTRITADAQPPQPRDDVAGGPAAPVAAAATRAVAEAGPAPKIEPAKKSAPAPETAPKTTAPVQPPAAKDVKSSPQPAVIKTDNPKPPLPENAPSPAPASFTSIRASRTGAGAGAPPVAAPSRLSQIGGAATSPATGAAPPLPSPASDDVTDPARIAELAASLQPDPKARLDQSAADQGNANDAPRSEMPGLFVRSTANKDRAVQAAAAKGPALRHEDEKQRMTVFGARQSAVRGKPRFLGLILTAILLLFLVGVAAWASVFLEDGLARFFRGGDDIQLADVPAADEADDVAAQDPASSGIAPLPEGDAPRIASLPRDTAPRPEVEALPNRPSPLAPSEAMARYAATGIWQMAPAAPEIPGAGAPVDDIYQVSIDPSVSFGALASLPRRQPDGRDTRPEKPADPPLAGVRFDFDALGFVRATPEGAMTPEGVRVVAGLPPLTPPADMAQTVTVTVTATTGSTADGEQVPIVAPVGDPALAAVRPRVRPQTALSGNEAVTEQEDQSAPQQDDETQLTPTESETRAANAASTAAFVGNPSLAALRPRPRPASAVGAATIQTAAVSDAATLAAGATLNGALVSAAQAGAQIADDAEEPETLDDSAFDSATPQAVTASLTPLRRPGDFETIVKRTRAQAAATPVPATQQIQPALPTRASVANQATEKNVLNLREVNLIGVYGSTASRRALVRLGNGRYKKVRVGDTLDGGQVAAIGNSELHYVKRGRNVVLKMPQG
ncbi:hypothetical protein [Roseovarius arcticus]|uniref:hypothetical protein n=1 Tax=Roseovarius arcticus TaxID=2547404 RepID=UPI0011103881|nr:hypothetical protein [Roseovarius arcticus]